MANMSLWEMQMLQACPLILPESPPPSPGPPVPLEAPLKQSPPPTSRPVSCADTTFQHTPAQYLLYTFCVTSGSLDVHLEVGICPLGDPDDPGRKNNLFFPP